MKINLDFIYKIFNLQIKLKKDSDKIKLSTYEEQIPMYDIYSQKIYPINKTNIHYRLIDSHYRFINDEVYRWLKQLYDKYKDVPIRGEKLKYNLMILDNYDIPTLIETSYKTLYKYSPQLGLSVSICKRNSFSPFVYHLKPYYSKLELIKLGQNMQIIQNVDLEKLIDIDTHYDICKKVSFNDVSFDEINTHSMYIVSHNITSWICFYSWIGSFLFNKFLRNLETQKINKLLYNGIIQIVNSMKNAPPLNKEYDIYRFIWDDSFIKNLKEGDVFTDNGFISTTRDPFYSPGLNGNFGLVLVKIKLPKDKKGIGLLIENFSLFPKEEEILLPPFTKLKLISRDDNFKYYHTNNDFERLINRKYEFEYVTTDYDDFFNMITKYKPIEKKIVGIDIKTIELNGNDRIDIIKKFIQLSSNGVIYISNNNKLYEFTYQWFDSTSTSSYQTFYYNKIKDGIMFTIMDSNGYPFLNIELGQDLAVNYLNTMYYGIVNQYINSNILDLICHFGRIFYYKTAIIFNQYKSFIDFKNNYIDNNRIFLEQNLYNHDLYLYLTEQKKILVFDPFIVYKLGYWYLDDYFKKMVDTEIIDKIPEDIKNVKNNKELLIQIIEKYFYLYPKIISLLDKNITNNNYVVYNIYDRLLAEGLADNFKPSIEHTFEDAIDDNFKLIFRQPIRRL
jgi:hypothetical protein